MKKLVLTVVFTISTLFLTELFAIESDTMMYHEDSYFQKGFKIYGSYFNYLGPLVLTEPKQNWEDIESFIFPMFTKIERQKMHKREISSVMTRYYHAAKQSHKKQPNADFKWFEDNAKDSNVQYLLATLYAANKQPDSAIEMLKKAAKQKNAHAILGLALNELMANNKKNGYKLLKCAAEYGDSTAQTLLGVAMQLRHCGKYDDAIYWYKLGAAQGNRDAQMRLGMSYMRGFTVKKDEKEGVKYYQLSAEQGLDEAKYYLAECYKNGIGVKQDIQKAKSLKEEIKNK